MLHADFSGIFDLLDRTAQNCIKSRRGDGAGYSNFTLATDLHPGDGGVALVKGTDSGCRKKKTTKRRQFQFFMEAIGDGDK